MNKESKYSKGQQENQQNRERYAKPQKQKYVRPEDVITENTQIPDMPKELLHEPNQKQFEQQTQKYQDEIQFLIKEQQTFIEKTIGEIKNKKNQSRESVSILKEDFDFKIKKQKEIKIQFDEAGKELDLKKAAFNKYQEQSDRLKIKMKNSVMSSEQIQNAILELKDQISNKRLTNKQELDNVQQISKYETILPYAYQQDEIQKILKERLIEKKAAQKSFFEVKEQYQALKKIVDSIKIQINDFQSMTKEEQDLVQPLIDEKKNQTTLKINKLKEDKQKAYDAYNEQCDKVKEQQKLIEKIEWMKKEKKAIISRQKQEKVQQEIKLKKQQEYEQKKKEQDELEKELENDTYDENVSTCNLLIDYCKKLIPKQMVQQNIIEQPKVDIETTLKTNLWAKDNVSLVVSKKDSEFVETQVLSKKDKQKKKQQEIQNKDGSNKQGDDQSNKNKKKQEVKEALNHKIEVINLFDHVKVSPPMFTNNLQEAIDLISEKKEYFLNMPKEQKEQSKKEDSNQKKDPKQKKQNQTLDFQETSFPGL